MVPHSNEENIQTVRRKLKEVARSRQLVTYTEVGKWIGMDRRDVGREILDPINELEHEAGRSSLSALVVSASSRKPGPGFFAVARIKGWQQGQDDDSYWCREVERVYAVFSKGEPTGGNEKHSYTAHLPSECAICRAYDDGFKDGRRDQAERFREALNHID